MTRNGMAASLFWKRFTVVMSGTAIAQVIPFATMPILTRLLPPDVLGPYFIWLGVVAVLSIFLSLRLDVAIFNAQTDKELLNTLQTAVFISLILALILWFMVWGLGILSPNLIEKLKLNLWSTEAIIMGTAWAINMVVQSAYLYGGDFKRQALVKIMLAVAVAFSQVGAVLLGWGVHAIIILQAIATIIVLLINLFDISKIYRINLFYFNFSSFINILKVNWRFPVFSMPADLASTITGQLPILILGQRFGVEIAGQYALMNKSVAAPSKLIAGSVLSVFKEEASRQFRERGECKSIYLKTLKRLAFLGIIPFGLLYLYSDFLFGIIFGDEWRGAGEIASILAPMLYLQFIASPLSYTLYLSGKNLEDLVWQLFSLFCVAMILIYGGDSSIVIKLISMTYSLLYCLNIYLSYRAAKNII